MGEPSSDLAGLAVRKESLVLDLRPLGQLKSKQERAYALVEARYDIERKGPSKTVDLVFIAPAQEGKAEVWLDDQAVPFRAEKTTAIPTAWSPPKTTPRAGGGDPLAFEPSKPQESLRFSLQFRPGPHQVRVKYDLRPNAVCSRSPLRFWQLAYVLAPARQWASFGTLEATVLAPPDWKVATSLPMEATPEGWKGHWQGIPADSLALSAQAPVPTQWPLIPGMAALGMVVSTACGWVLGGWLRRGQRSKLWAPLLGLLVAGAVMIAFLLGGLTALEQMNSQPPGQQSWTWSYGASMEVIFGSFLVGAGGWFLTVLIALVAARRRP